MADSFALPNGEIVAELSVDPNTIYCTGSAEHPIIVIPAVSAFRCPNWPGGSICFRHFQGRLSAFDSTYIAYTTVAETNTTLGAGETRSKEQLFIEIPIAASDLRALNRKRNGGEVRMRLDCKLKTERLHSVGSTTGQFAQRVWGFVEAHLLSTSLSFVIPRDRWIMFLDQLKIESVYVIELPGIAVDNCAELKESHGALRHAITLHNQGLYREAVAQCRIVLDPLMEVVNGTDKSKVMQLKTSWQTRLGKPTYDWLNNSLTVVRGPTNQAHHTSSAVLDQLEAQSILTIVANLLSYLSKLSQASDA